MEPQAQMNKIKDIYEQIISYIESDDDDDDDDGQQSIVLYFENQKIENRYELKEILYILLKISKNHCRQSNFFNKIDQIFYLLEDQIKNIF